MIIDLAGLPQTGQTSYSFSCSRGMQRLVTPASSFIRASQAGSSHHMVRMKPVFSGSPAMERISSQVAAV